MSTKPLHATPGAGFLPGTHGRFPWGQRPTQQKALQPQQQAEMPAERETTKETPSQQR